MFVWPLVESLFSLIHSYLDIVNISALDFCQQDSWKQKIVLYNCEKQWENSQRMFAEDWLSFWMQPIEIFPSLHITNSLVMISISEVKEVANTS